MVEKKITFNISVGYNYYQWLINRAVHLWETCSIKSAGQCVCQQIALVYFPQPCTPHALLAALLGSIDVYQWSPLESYQSVTLRRQRVNPVTYDLCPLTRDDP